MFKFWTLMIVTMIAVNFVNSYDHMQQGEKNKAHIQQLNSDKGQIMMDSNVESMKRLSVSIGVVLMWIVAYVPDFRRYAGMLSISLLLVLTGCRKPFEPVQLEVIEPNEVGFLISNTDVNDQKSTASEDFDKHIVNTQQVKIPQMWVQTGYSTVFWNGEWRPSARLIKVDTASVTREWTADQNSGTSQKNEAIWVMTSDQVEFSTGWTCTAKIASRKDAAVFLSNYRNGSLEQVMDQEVRSKIQALFGLAVTDLPMETLRTAATPVIIKTVDDVKSFFLEKGITITNLGITGGFVYKNPKVLEKMAEVFTAEQEKSIAVAKTMAQIEENKRIQLEAVAKSEAILTQKKAEADGIKAVAEAKAFEIEKAQQNKEIYIQLKELEIDKLKAESWDGKYPVYYMGVGNAPTLLLNTPEVK